MPDDRTMPIRRWVSVLVASLFLAPAIALLTIGVILFAPTHGPVFPSADAIERLRRESDQWEDASWQEETSVWLTDESMDAVLLANNEPVWATSDHPELVNNRVIHVEEVAENQRLILYAPNDQGPPQALETWLVPIALISSLVLVVMLIAWFLRRSIIEPLTATSEAAQQLASGSYDVGIPRSRVREVNDLAASFESMRTSLHESINRQAAIEEERRFLISAVAHDLRTPLFALRGSLEGIVQGVADSDEKREQYLQIALRRANDLEKLISDLFAWSRLELTDLEMDRDHIHLAELLETTVDGIRPQADAREIELLLAGPDVEIDADTAMLRRALDNLLDNALAHSPDGGTIEIATTRELHHVVIAIRDHGPGIPKDELELIFTPMYRGEESRNRSTGGAGLGLGVARRIAAAHGGSIRAMNHAEGGAVFELRLPAR